MCISVPFILISIMHIYKNQNIFKKKKREKKEGQQEEEEGEEEALMKYFYFILSMLPNRAFCF